MTPEITTHDDALEALRTYEKKLKAELGVDLGKQMSDPIREYIRNLFDPNRIIVKRQLSSEQMNCPPLQSDEAA